MIEDLLSTFQILTNIVEEIEEVGFSCPINPINPNPPLRSLFNIDDLSFHRFNMASSMTYLDESPLPADKYNALPHIDDNKTVEANHEAGRNQLLALDSVEKATENLFDSSGPQTL